MILQAWLTLPSCLASSSKPTLARMIFWSWVIVMVSIPGAGGRGAVPARGENRAPPPGTHFETNNDCQIKCKLLQIMAGLDQASGNIERGEQGRGAVTFVGMAEPRQRFAIGQLQPTLGALQSLDVRLLVDRKHHGVRGRLSSRARQCRPPSAQTPDRC